MAYIIPSFGVVGRDDECRIHIVYGSHCNGYPSSEEGERAIAIYDSRPIELFPSFEKPLVHFPNTISFIPYSLFSESEFPCLQKEGLIKCLLSGLDLRNGIDNIAEDLESFLAEKSAEFHLDA